MFKGEMMNSENLIEGLIQLYNSTYKQRLNKVSYKNEIEKLKENNQELLQGIAEAIDVDNPQYLEIIARIIPEYVADNLSQYSSKRKRQTHQVDNNMNMVCYYIPIINSIDSTLAERTVEIWNATMDNSNIGVSTIDGIDGGFKRGFCYITTAVCQTLNKGDDCYELKTLRDYRDQYLLSTIEGEKIVQSYYNIAPTIVNRINKDENSIKIYENILTTYIQPCLTLIEMGKNKECSRLYSEMVISLEKKYM
jgi:hypothetical protein